MPTHVSFDELPAAPVAGLTARLAATRWARAGGLSRMPAVVLFAVLLAACSGEDEIASVGDTSSAQVDLCASAPNGYAAYADTQASAGKAAAATVAGCSGALADIVWTQTAGPTVSLLSAKSQTLGFEPSSAASYQFRADFHDASGQARAAEVTVAVGAPATASSITIRGDQSVRAGGNASLRAWPSLVGGDTVQSISWSQIDGPAVTLDTSDQARIIFKAPTVTRDTLLRFRATLRTNGGTVDRDDAIVLVEAYAQAPTLTDSPYVFDDFHVSRVYPYRANGPYAGVLVRCAFDAGLQFTGAGKNLCPLSTLPFIDQDSNGGVPTVDQVMNHVLVSHDWMGAAFEQFLRTQDANDDIKRLLNGVTAIVVGTHVRPSFYFALTGAIHLDADNFWLNPAERDLIDETPDFRSNFDKDLGYSGLWRYTLNNQSIFRSFPADVRTSRDPGYLLYESAWLLYHELGHASDFLPPAVRPALDTKLSAWENIAPRFNGKTLPSDLLTANLPLQSADLRALAQVKFFGSTANAAQRAFTPTQVGDLFRTDRATDEYNFATTREDIAMLFEEFMMSYRLGIRRDVAITDKITATTTGNTLFVRWGQRGRAADPAVSPRIQYVVGQLAPWIDANAVLGLPAPLAMRSGDTWNGNLVLPAPIAMATTQSVRGDELSSSHQAAALAKAQRRAGGGPKLPGERAPSPIRF